MKKLSLLAVLIAVAAMAALSCQRDSNPLGTTFSEDTQLSRAGKKPAPGQAKKAAQGSLWNVPGDFATIQEAIDDASVSDGDIIMVSPGTHAGATVTKAVEIKGIGGAVIKDGPVLVTLPGEEPWALKIGLFFQGDDVGSGTKISHLRFETVEFPVMSRGADDVTVEHCTMVNSIQAVSNWNGSNWKISHNEILDLRTANGGGIGILVGNSTSTLSNDNVISHNKISGTLHVWENDGGDYCGTGIVLYADFRGSRLGANQIAFNRVVKNKVSLISDNANLVPVVAIELTDTRDDLEADPYPVIFGNAIGFNDLRGTETQIALTPEELDEVNDISRNLGKNRGHGMHPSAFGPGGN